MSCLWYGLWALGLWSIWVWSEVDYEDMSRGRRESCRRSGRITREPMMVRVIPHHSLKLAREGKGIGSSYTFPHSQVIFPHLEVFETAPKLPKNKANMTRENEASYLEKINESIAKGTSWERITELIQLENSRESMSAL